MSGSIQSSNYVSGVSGWKIDAKTGGFEMHCSDLSVVGKDEAALYSGAAVTHSPKRSIVVDGVTYINEACIKEASVEGKLPVFYTIKASILSSGKAVMVGVGPLGECESLAKAIKDCQPDAALKAGGVSAALGRMAAVIRETKLYEPILADPEQFKASFADGVKEVIRSELRQGGLLWRSH